MKRILQIGLGWGLALGIAGAIMMIVYLAAPRFIEQNLDLRQRSQRAEIELAYEKKRSEQRAEQELAYLKSKKELDIEMEQQKRERLSQDENQ
jgi:uncharacterized membrane protein YhiD involved in acid resistance